jgi:hypothetical protein
MNVKSMLRGSSLALVLCAGLAAAASAQKSGAPEDGQTPPAQSQTPPPAEPAKEEPKCVTNDADFKQNGKSNAFVIALTNTCEKRMKCTVNAYVVTAGGPTTGRKVLILAPKSQGAAAQQSYVMKVKDAGGTASISSKCTEL